MVCLFPGSCLWCKSTHWKFTTVRDYLWYTTVSPVVWLISADRPQILLACTYTLYITLPYCAGFQILNVSCPRSTDAIISANHSNISVKLMRPDNVISFWIDRVCLKGNITDYNTSDINRVIILLPISIDQYRLWSLIFFLCAASPKLSQFYSSRCRHCLPICWGIRFNWNLEES